MVVEDVAGHSATLPSTTAIHRLNEVLTKVLQSRDRLGLVGQPPSGGGMFGGEGKAIGVNIVYLRAGVETPASPTGFVMNIIPATAEAGIDIRIPPGTDVDELEKEIAMWVSNSPS